MQGVRRDCRARGGSLWPQCWPGLVTDKPRAPPSPQLQEEGPTVHEIFVSTDQVIQSQPFACVRPKLSQFGQWPSRVLCSALRFALACVGKDHIAPHLARYLYPPQSLLSSTKYNFA